jgi:hypothetical protein
VRFLVAEMKGVKLQRFGQQTGRKPKTLGIMKQKEVRFIFIQFCVIFYPKEEMVIKNV